MKNALTCLAWVLLAVGLLVIAVTLLGFFATRGSTGP